MLVTKKKRIIFEKRMKTFQQQHHLIYETWSHAFSNIDSNKRAIADRGWFPLSKALLLHPLIMSSMTEIMIREENERKILPSTVLNDLNSKVYSDCNGVVTFGVNDITSNYRFNFLEVL